MLSRGLHTLANEIKDRLKRCERVTPETLTAIACVIEAAAREAAVHEARAQNTAARITRADLAANVILFPGVELHDDVGPSGSGHPPPSGRGAQIQL